MRVDRMMIFAVATVILLSAAVPMAVVSTAPKHEETVRVVHPYESINFYLYFEDGDDRNIIPNTDSPMKGAGSTLSSVIENAFGKTEGYSVELLATGAVASVNGVEPSEGKEWIVYQWDPPKGWSAVAVGSTADVGMEENTSYLIAMSDYRESSGKTVYTPPDIGGPKSLAVFYLLTSPDQYGVTAAQLGEGEEGEKLRKELSGGIFITGYGTNAAEAFVDACANKFGWEGPFYEGDDIVLRVPESRCVGLDDNQKIGLRTTSGGWLYNFMGLSDRDAGGGFWIYWTQYHWTDVDYEWKFNGYVMGYYDPAVTKYLGLVYTISSMSGSHGPSVDPHDYEASE